MVRRYSSYKNISNFVENVGKNWRNSIYVTCSVCKNEKQHCCEDILVSFNSMGVPTCITVTDANYIAIYRIDGRLYGETVLWADDDDELMYKPISWVDSLKYIPKKYHKELLENSSQVEKECYEASRFSLKGAAT